MRRIVRPGDVVFDVGAHIGLHNVMFSAAVGPAGRLHAFEANPRKIHALAATLGRLPNATLHPFGLSDHSGEAVLFVPEDQAMASPVDWTEGRVGAVQRTSCRLRTLDEVIESGDAAPPDFIKCDVEGAELSGARLTPPARSGIACSDRPVDATVSRRRSSSPESSSLNPQPGRRCPWARRQSPLPSGRGHADAGW